MSRVGIVIPNYNGMEHLPACLGSLAGQTFRDFDISVVDNGSMDASLDYIRSTWPQVRLICFDDNRGFAAAVNAGIAASTSDYVVLLNNDTEAAPDWLDRLVAGMDAHPDFSFGSSKLVRADDPDRIDSAGHAFSLWLGSATRVGDGEPAGRYTENAWVFGATAAASVYRGSLFADIGPFDDTFFFGLEDVEFDLRANVAGHRCLFVHDAVVRHRRSTTYTPSPELLRMDVRNRLWAVGKNLPPLALALWLIGKALRVLWWPVRRIVRPARQNDSVVGRSWTRVPLPQAARTFAASIAGLPAQRRSVKHIRRRGSVELIRIMRSTSRPDVGRTQQLI